MNNIGLVSDLIRKKYKNATDIEVLAEGHHSEAYKFAVGKGELVIRTADELKFFEKDEYIYSHHANLKVPKFIDSGELKPGLYYAITSYVDGEVMAANWKFSEHINVSAIRGDFIQSLIRISREDVSDKAGYGGISSDTGNGGYESWQSFLEGWYTNPEVVGRIAEQKESGKLDKSIMSEAEAATKQLIHDNSVYESRHLIHGDYQPHNVITKGNTVQSVLDWGNAKYGDFAYDLMWTTMHGPEVATIGRLVNAYSGSGFNMDNLEVRMKLVKVSILISWAMFSNEIGNMEESRRNQQQLLEEVQK